MGATTSSCRTFRCTWSTGWRGKAALRPTVRARAPAPRSTSRTSTAPTKAASPSPEVLEIAARRRTALALVLRSDAGAAIGRVGRRRHAQEADLADLHARIERDRQVGDVGQLK